MYFFDSFISIIYTNKVLFIIWFVSMPTEQNTTWVGGAPLWVSDDTSSSTVSQPTSPVADQISDLGDILLEKSIDEVQSNDFMPVWENDLTQLDNITNNNTESITESSVDNRTITSDSTNTDSSIDNNNIDLGDIDLSIPNDGSESNTSESTSTPINNTIEWNDIITEETTSANDETVNNIDEINIDLPTIEEPVTENVQPTEIIESVVAETNTPSSEQTIDDNSIDLSWVSLWDSPQNEETATNSDTENTTDDTNSQNNDSIDNVNFDALEDIDLPEATTISINSWESNDEKHEDQSMNIEEPSIAQNNEIPEISLDNIASTDEIQASQIEEQLISEDIDTTSSTIENEKSWTVAVEPIVEPVLEEIIEAPIIESNNWIEVSPVENTINNNPVINEATVELPQDTWVNIDDKLASIAQVAEKVEEGIDLDSLVWPDEQKNSLEDNTETNTPVITNQEITAAIAQTTEATTPQTMTQDKKPLKMALVGMGIVAVLGAGYFWYKTVFPMGLGNTEPSNILSWSMTPDLYSGDTISGDILSGDIWQNNSGEVLLDDILSGSTNSGDTDIWALPDGGTDSNWNTDGQTQTRTLDDIKNDADMLVSKARKLLIKATIAKNGPARISAFSIQKDVDSFVQTLANTTDITTLEASEKTLEQLSQRLTSLENRLNGSSN